MRIGLPNNIFSRLFFETFPAETKDSARFEPASMLAGALEAGKFDVALLPTFDLLKHRKFFVSASYGISFEGTISNTYLYFNPGQVHLHDLALLGDVSSLDAILSKILISEMYDDDVRVFISTDPAKVKAQNKLIAGDGNWNEGAFLKGLSFTEEVGELLSLPFVNYVFTAKSPDKLEEFHQLCSGANETLRDLRLPPSLIGTFPEKSRVFLSENFHDVIYRFDEHDKYGIIELLQLAYLHGIIPEILEVPFV